MLDATPLLRLYAANRRRQLAGLEPAETQESEVRRLLTRGASTAFGKAHGFGAIKSVADYQSAVPLRRYEDFWREYWQKAFPRLGGTSWPWLTCTT